MKRMLITFAAALVFLPASAPVLDAQQDDSSARIAQLEEEVARLRDSLEELNQRNQQLNAMLTRLRRELVKQREDSLRRYEEQAVEHALRADQLELQLARVQQERDSLRRTVELLSSSELPPPDRPEETAREGIEEEFPEDGEEDTGLRDRFLRTARRFWEDVKEELSDEGIEADDIEKGVRDLAEELARGWGSLFKDEEAGEKAPVIEMLPPPEPIPQPERALEQLMNVLKAQAQFFADYGRYAQIGELQETEGLSLFDSTSMEAFTMMCTMLEGDPDGDGKMASYVYECWEAFGYVFEHYVPEDAGARFDFICAAFPLEYSTGEELSYYVAGDCVIRYQQGGRATATSPPLD